MDFVDRRSPFFLKHFSRFRYNTHHIPFLDELFPLDEKKNILFGNYSKIKHYLCGRIQKIHIEMDDYYAETFIHKA